MVGDDDAGGQLEQPESLDPSQPETQPQDADPGQSGADAPESSPQPQDPYQQKLDAFERRFSDLEASFRRSVAPPVPRPNQIPAALNKPQDQWTAQDLFAVNQWQIRQQAEQVAAESKTRYQLNEKALGKDNDYDSVIGKYLEPLLEQNPEIIPFVQNLPAADRYMLGLLHEIHAKSGGNLVRTINAIRNGLGARLQGHQDLTKQVNQAARREGLRLVQGSGGRQSHYGDMKSEQIAHMSDAEFRAFMQKVAG